MEPCDFCNGQKQSLEAIEDTGLKYKQGGTKDRSLNLNTTPEKTLV